MTYTQTNFPDSEQEPTRKVITIEEDESFDRAFKEVIQDYSRTLKRLADGDTGTNPELKAEI